ncbi:hypothetical protein GGS20DRAFT_115137 [Poronia punctata]|nr:hypothetical protein GGS20DRAFT_115137 [Poronia punctata]
MSQKITPKNLTYDTSLPPFLARLKGHQSSRSGPDPILAANRRPGQKRSASEEAEDAPLVVDEEGNVVEFPAAEDEDDTNTNTLENEAKSGEEKDEKTKTEMETEKEKERVAAIGSSRKRKVGRVIGGGDQNKTDGEIAKASADARRLAGEKQQQQQQQQQDGKASVESKKINNNNNNKSVGKKKTAKKIKLSFGDENGD